MRPLYELCALFRAGWHPYPSTGQERDVGALWQKSTRPQSTPQRSGCALERRSELSCLHGSEGCAVRSDAVTPPVENRAG